MSTLMPLLRTAPQFAYSPHRSTIDCLLRVHAHFHQVRVGQHGARPSIYQRHAGAKTLACTGGISLSVDLKGAFNAVPRDTLYTGLMEQGVSGDVIHLVRQLHYQSTYRVRNSSGEEKIRTTNGIKQGCRVAPTLWVSYTLQLLARLEQRIGAELMRRTISLFADDLFAALRFDTLQAAHDAVQVLNVILTTLEALGMHINFDKSAILLAVSGTQSRTFRSKYLTKRNNAWHFKLMVSNREVLLPLKSSHVYLGTVISYRNGPELTTSHRLQASGGKWYELKRALHNPRVLSTEKRLEIWRAGVQTSLLYGLCTVPLGYTCRQKIRGKTARQLRHIAHLPAHLTHISNEELFLRLGVADPLTTVADTLKTRLTQLLSLRNHLPDDVACSDDTLHYASWLLEHLQEQAATEHHTKRLAAVEPTAQHQVACPDCGLYFTNHAAMKSHRTQRHGVSQAPAATTQDAVAAHSLGGLPQCKHCKVKFSSWYGLTRHVRNGVCSGSSVDPPEAAEAHTDAPPDVEDLQSGASAKPATEESPTYVPSRDPEVIAGVATAEGWLAFARTPRARQALSAHCCACGQWATNATGVKHHLKSLHADFWCHMEQALKLCDARRHDFSRKQPCPFCGLNVDQPSRHKVRCAVLYQSALLHCRHVHGNDYGGARHLRPLPPVSADQRGRSEPATEQASASGAKGAHKPARRTWKPKWRCSHVLQFSTKT